MKRKILTSKQYRFQSANEIQITIQLKIPLGKFPHFFKISTSSHLLPCPQVFCLQNMVMILSLTQLLAHASATSKELIPLVSSFETGILRNRSSELKIGKKNQSPQDNFTFPLDSPKTEFIYKKLCISSYIFKLQPPSKYSPIDVIIPSRWFFHCSKQFLSLSILMPFNASAIVLFHIRKMFPFEEFIHPGKLQNNSKS